MNSNQTQNQVKRYWIWLSLFKNNYMRFASSIDVLLIGARQNVTRSEAILNDTKQTVYNRTEILVPTAIAQQ